MASPVRPMTAFHGLPAGDARPRKALQKRWLAPAPDLRSRVHACNVRTASSLTCQTRFAKRPSRQPPDEVLVVRTILCRSYSSSARNWQSFFRSRHSPSSKTVCRPLSMQAPGNGPASKRQIVSRVPLRSRLRFRMHRCGRLRETSRGAGRVLGSGGRRESRARIPAHRDLVGVSPSRPFGGSAPNPDAANRSPRPEELAS